MRPNVPLLTAISPGVDQLPDARRSWFEALAAAGVDAIQIRAKDSGDLELLELTREAVEVTAGRAVVLVNGRPDIALAGGAGGVHLPASGLPVAAVRKWLGDELLIGCSTHRVEEVDAARRAGADYVYFSPIFLTPGKGARVGVSGLREATGRQVPVIALGGITIAQFGPVAEAGAAGVAGIRLFGNADELEPLVAAARLAFAS